MTTRRDFLRISLVGASALALSCKLQGSPNKHCLGVQLYTVRKQAEADLPGTLAAIRKIGFDEVELYWDIYNRPAAELKRIIADAGLKAPSGHFDYDGLSSKLSYAKELGLDHVICPMLPKTMWNSAEGFHQAADQLNQWGKEVHKLGMSFGFHDHNYEFQKFGNESGFDILTKNTDPQFVKLEMDCYWITQAGQDPVAMLEKFGERFVMLHIKDRKPGFPNSQVMDKAAEHFTEVGNGTIDWKPILAKAKALGIKHYFVEQDECDHPPLQSIAVSYNNLQKMML